MWYLNLKNWLIIILLVIGIAVSGLYLWQRITVVNQKNTIGDLQVLTADLQNQIVDYKSNIAKIKKLQKEQQQIANNTSSIQAQINKINPAKCIGGENEEETISDITYYFNSGGLLTARNTETSREILPTTDTTRVSGWTIKQIIDNYLALADYALKLEKVNKCYESTD